ncbi:MAG: hypothetical protein LBG72_09795 [Spirochaetaceae bacterium]|nr:hypothetical protein [Spirochaetaceae bacterium]
MNSEQWTVDSEQWAASVQDENQVLMRITPLVLIYRILPTTHYPLLTTHYSLPTATDSLPEIPGRF